jgi:hypothetical protein
MMMKPTFGRTLVMKIAQTRTAAALAMSALLLTAACGGAGDDAGSLTPFSVNPKEWKIDTCTSGLTVTYFVYGGTAPYQIDNTYPPGVILNKTTLSSRGESFTATTTAACVNPANIIINDHVGHQITATLINGSS